MRLIIFISLISVTALRVWLLESRHDYEVIKMKVPGAQSNWKIFGNINEITHLAVPVVLLGVFMGAAYFTLLLVLVFVWWITHDAAMGWYLKPEGKRNIFYLGSSWVDELLLRMCQRSGKAAFFVRIFLATFPSYAYFAL
jgi:hypothetical protein